VNGILDSVARVTVNSTRKDRTVKVILQDIKKLETGALIVDFLRISAAQRSRRGIGLAALRFTLPSYSQQKLRRAVGDVALLTTQENCKPLSSFSSVSAKRRFFLVDVTHGGRTGYQRAGSRCSEGCGRIFQPSGMSYERSVSALSKDYHKARRTQV